MEMENTVLNHQNESKDMLLSVYAQSNLRASARWASFLAIVGFVGVGFMILISIQLFTTSTHGYNTYYGSTGHESMAIMGTIYLVMAVVSFFPAYFLIMFANKIKKATLNQDPIRMEEASNFMRIYFTYVGVMTIITILVVIFIFFAVLGAAYSY